MYKFYIKLFFLLFFILFYESAFAEASGLGGGFFGLGKNDVAVSGNSAKDVLHERQAKRTVALSKEQKAELVRDEQRKESTQPSPGNLNSDSKKNRMTPEERRALRRQIHDASSEVYVSPK